MKFEFLPEADEEFREASGYYENEPPGVGLAFIAEVHRVISMVIFHPLAAQNTKHYTQQSAPLFPL